jgi:hypothetical protein
MKKADTPFVSALRTRGAPFKLGSPSAAPLQVRAQVLEAWDAIMIDGVPEASVKIL